MRRSKKPKNSSVLPDEMLTSEDDPLPLMNRSVDLRRVDPHIVARARRLGGGGNDLVDGAYPLWSIDRFLDHMVYEDHGAGMYEVRFHLGKRPLLFRNGRLERYTFSVDLEWDSSEDEEPDAPSTSEVLVMALESLVKGAVEALSKPQEPD